MRGGGGCGASANEYSCANGAQINFEDLTPYLTYAFSVITIYVSVVYMAQDLMILMPGKSILGAIGRGGP
jgi:hypothetical protein